LRKQMKKELAMIIEKYKELSEDLSLKAEEHRLGVLMGGSHPLNDGKDAEYLYLKSQAYIFELIVKDLEELYGRSI